MTMSVGPQSAAGRRELFRAAAIAIISSVTGSAHVVAKAFNNRGVVRGGDTLQLHDRRPKRTCKLRIVPVRCLLRNNNRQARGHHPCFYAAREVYYKGKRRLQLAERTQFHHCVNEVVLRERSGPFLNCIARI